jgi:hypothetical protein
MLTTQEKRAAEKRLTVALGRTAGLIKSGTDPNEAIVKVAREEGLSAGEVRMMAAAYNIGRAARQRHSTTSLFEKAADFPLADAALILGELFPPDVKAAAEAARPPQVSVEYNFRPNWLEKRAEVDLPDAPNPTVYPRYLGRIDQKYLAVQSDVHGTRQRLLDALRNEEEKVASAYCELVDYFHRRGPIPYGEARLQAELFFGAPAAPILAKVAGNLHLKEAQTEAAALSRHPLDLSSMPYLAIRRILVGARNCQEAFAKAAAFEEAVLPALMELGRTYQEAHGREVQPLPPDPSLSILRRLRGEKRAFLGPLVSGVGQGAALGLGEQTGGSILKELLPEDKDKLRNKAMVELMDPGHEGQMRAVRLKAALHGVLQSPYFQGEDPKHVTNVFNQLTQLSPRLVEQPMLLEAALRRHISQGQVDPHDLDQLAGIEAKLKAREELPRAVRDILPPYVGVGGGGRG